MNVFLAQPAPHRKPATFLKALIEHLDGQEHRRLSDRLAKAEGEERCVRHAVLLATLLLLLTAAGLGYCAILVPEVFHNPTHLMMRILAVVGLGTLISLAVFLGYLFWHRALVAALHQECRQQVLALARSRLNGHAPASPAAPAEAESPGDPRRSAGEEVLTATPQNPSSRLPLVETVKPAQEALLNERP
jgi:hypothetical protein